MPRGSRLLLPLIVAALCAPGVLTATPSDGASWRTGRSSLPPGHVIGVPWLGAPPLFQASSADALPFGPGAPEQSAWKQAGVYGLEFGGALVGTSVAAFATGYMMYVSSDISYMFVDMASYPTYAISSTFLSATGTHLVGRSLGQNGSFGHALVGGALGGVVGSVVLVYWRNFSSASSMPESVSLMSIAVLLPPLCAVVVYNVWKSRQSD